MADTKKFILETDRQQYQDDKQRVAAYKEILATEDGQRFLMDFLINMGFFSVQEVKDDSEVFIQQGKRIACNYLLNFLSINTIKEA